jgi:hypothetical protein
MNRARRAARASLVAPAFAARTGANDPKPSNPNVGSTHGPPARTSGDESRPSVVTRRGSKPTGPRATAGERAPHACSQPERTGFVASAVSPAIHRRFDPRFSPLDPGQGRRRCAVRSLARLPGCQGGYSRVFAVDLQANERPDRRASSRTRSVWLLTDHSGTALSAEEHQPGCGSWVGCGSSGGGTSTWVRLIGCGSSGGCGSWVGAAHRAEEHQPGCGSWGAAHGVRLMGVRLMEEHQPGCGSWGRSGFTAKKGGLGEPPGTR